MAGDVAGAGAPAAAGMATGALDGEPAAAVVPGVTGVCRGMVGEIIGLFGLPLTAAGGKPEVTGMALGGVAVGTLGELCCPEGEGSDPQPQSVTAIAAPKIDSTNLRGCMRVRSRFEKGSTALHALLLSVHTNDNSRCQTRMTDESSMICRSAVAISVLSHAVT